ncbi:hypothetical protein ASE07_25095 [Noviherbaspirillum sp. Root189]|nr:hypothetical protein ASE07_25095 [Noviherbaspirillum sp. Root189]
MTALVSGPDVRLLLLGTAVLWGGNLAVIKLLGEHFDPIWLSGVRIACACIPQCLLLLHLRPTDWRLTRMEVGALMLCALLMVYLNQWLLAAGIGLSSATNASLITALTPLTAATLALCLMRERPGPHRLVGLGLGLAGVALVIVNRPSAELTRAGFGDLLLLAGVFAFTLGAALVQRLTRRLDALRISLFIHAAGAVFLIGHAAALTFTRDAPVRLPTDIHWWWMAALSGAISTGIGGLLWNMAVGRVGIGRASVWLYWVPVFGLAGAVLFVGEPLTVWHLLGLALILGGTQLGTRGRSG